MNFKLLRRAMFAWWWLSRGLTLGVRVMVLDQAGQVYLVRHSYVPGWHLPGGGVERGEDALEAVRRELVEETGIKARGAFQLHGLFHNRAYSSGDHVALFVLRDFEEGKRQASPFEIVDGGFFAIDDLPEGTSAATLRRLEEVLHGTPASPLW